MDGHTGTINTDFTLGLKSRLTPLRMHPILCKKRQRNSEERINTGSITQQTMGIGSEASQNALKVGGKCTEGFDLRIGLVVNLKSWKDRLKFIYEVMFYSKN